MKSFSGVISSTLVLGLSLSLPALAQTDTGTGTGTGTGTNTGTSTGTGTNTGTGTGTATSTTTNTSTGTGTSTHHDRFERVFSATVDLPDAATASDTSYMLPIGKSVRWFFVRTLNKDKGLCHSQIRNVAVDGKLMPHNGIRYWVNGGNGQLVTNVTVYYYSPEMAKACQLSVVGIK